MIIKLRLRSGPIIRINVNNIATYVRYEYIKLNGEYRNDDFTTITMIDGKHWTVQDAPEEIDRMIDEIINCDFPIRVREV